MALDQIQDEINEGEKEMSFLDHLEELRWHLIRSLIAIVVFAVAAFVAKDLIFGVILLGPASTDFITYQLLCQLSQLLQSEAFCIDELPFILQSRKVTGQFAMHITSSFVVGLVCTFPYAFWEIWRFIKPGLYPRERKAATGATFYVSFLFILGILFAYFVVTPVSIYFLANYQIDPSIKNEFDIVSYLTTVIMIILAGGILFQLPIIVYFLTKAGLVTPKTMRTYRKHAIIVILILGAMITPPDPFSQILISLPLLGLYQVSILISARVLRREEKAELALRAKEESRRDQYDD